MTESTKIQWHENMTEEELNEFEASLDKTIAENEKKLQWFEMYKAECAEMKQILSKYPTSWRSVLVRMESLEKDAIKSFGFFPAASRTGAKEDLMKWPDQKARLDAARESLGIFTASI